MILLSFLVVYPNSANAAEKGKKNLEQLAIAENVAAGNPPPGYSSVVSGVYMGGKSLSNQQNTTNPPLDNDSNSFANILPYGDIYIDTSKLNWNTPEGFIIDIKDKEHFKWVSETPLEDAEGNKSTSDPMGMGYGFEGATAIYYVGELRSYLENMTDSASSDGHVNVIGSSDSYLYSITYKNAAVLPDGSKGDLVLTMNKIQFETSVTVSQDSPYVVSGQNYSYNKALVQVQFANSLRLATDAKDGKKNEINQRYTQVKSEEDVKAIYAEANTDLPTSSRITNQAAAVNARNAIGGIYDFEIKVIDKKGDPVKGTIFFAANDLDFENVQNVWGRPIDDDDKYKFNEGMKIVEGARSYAVIPEYEHYDADSVAKGWIPIGPSPGQTEEKHPLKVSSDSTDGERANGVRFSSNTLVSYRGKYGTFDNVPFLKTNISFVLGGHLGDGGAIDKSDNPFVDDTIKKLYYSQLIKNNIIESSVSWRDVTAQNIYQLLGYTSWKAVRNDAEDDSYGGTSFDTGFAVLLDASGSKLQWSGSRAIGASIGTGIFGTSMPTHVDITHGTGGGIYVEGYDISNNCAPVMHEGTVSLGMNENVTVTTVPETGYRVKTIRIGNENLIEYDSYDVEQLPFTDNKYVDNIHNVIIERNEDDTYDVMLSDVTTPRHVHVDFTADYYFYKIWINQEPTALTMTAVPTRFTEEGYSVHESDGIEFSINNTDQYTVNGYVTVFDGNNSISPGNVVWEIKYPAEGVTSLGWAPLPIEKHPSNHNQNHVDRNYWFVTETVPQGMVVSYDNTLAQAPGKIDLYYDSSTWGAVSVKGKEKATELIQKTNRNKNAFMSPMGEGGKITNRKSSNVITIVDDVHLEIQKHLNGHGAAGFRYSLFKNLTDEEPIGGTTITASAGHMTILLPESFVNPGEYTFFLKEVDTLNNTNVTFDPFPVKVVVEIFEKGNTTEKSLAYSVTYQKQTESGWVNADKAEFNNKYQPAPGKATISVQKHLIGRKWLENEQYSFKLEPVDNAPLRVNGTLESSLTKTTVLNEQHKVHEAVFPELEFQIDDLLETDADHYVQDKYFTYKITEVIPEEAVNNQLNGVTYDPLPRYVYVHVHNSRTDGKLKVTFTDSEQKLNENTVPEINFENHYQADPVTVPLKVTKHILDKNGNELTDWRATDGTSSKDWSNMEFEFILTAIKDEPLPENDLTTATASSTSKTASFGDITFDKEGVYEYLVREIVPKGEATSGEAYGPYDPLHPYSPVHDGLLYDPVDHRILINVKDDQQGHLEAEVEYDDDKSSDALNIYNRKLPDAYVFISAKKVVKGAAYAEGEFIFYMEDPSDPSGYKDLHRGTNGADGYITFEPLTFTSASLDGQTSKDFYYIMKEVNDHEPGWEYDSKAVKFKITVSHPEGASEFTTSIQYIIDDGNEYKDYDRNDLADLTFTNKYNAEGNAIIEAEKHISGREWMEDDAFAFILTGEYDAPINIRNIDEDKTTQQKVTSLTATAKKENHVASFPKLWFTMEDLKNGDSYLDERDFVYRVHESGAGEITDGTYTNKGMTYAGDQFVLVHVRNNEATGKLDITYSHDESMLEYPQFINTYEAKGNVDAILGAYKQISGRKWQTGEGFTFQIKPLWNSMGWDLEKMPLPPNDTMVITSGGEAVTGKPETKSGYFEAITFNAPGVYDYEIEEVIPEVHLPNMIYTEEKHRVRVTVADMGDGTLGTPEIHYPATESQVPSTFINRYYGTDDGNNFLFSFTKEWRGEVQDISFVLYDPSGNVHRHAFKKEKISDTEYVYKAWLSTDGEYYVIEDPMVGYSAVYVNQGKYADVTDRVYNGGRIINFGVPNTGDGRNPLLLVAVTVGTLIGLTGLLCIRKKMLSKQ